MIFLTRVPAPVLLFYRLKMQQLVDSKTKCFHCGETCPDAHIRSDDHVFCCEGCKMVYQILNQSGLCDYYHFNQQPGSRRQAGRKDKFKFLDDNSIGNQLIHFKNGDEIHVRFYLPQIHCSSCLYLLENLRKLSPGVISSQVNFAKKELSVVLSEKKISLRELAELLADVGYEPYISLKDTRKIKPAPRKSLIYQLGVAGFCFANVMLLSFPEYFGLDATEPSLRSLFRILNFILALPVFFYSATPFYFSAWKSVKHGFLNIDAPIALAIIITFIRSCYEIISGTGAGYFDSMSGIVFFMLAGRILQEKTYLQLSFDRDYSSYFPIAVTWLKGDQEITKGLDEIRAGDTLLIHSQEMIPVDGILSRGKALIDYSFVTGESLPVSKEVGEIIYAGGRQTGTNIELLTIREVSQSYLTSLWNRTPGSEKEDEKSRSFVHLLSRYFTAIVLLIAAGASAYWWFYDPTKIWSSVTAVMIIACPCALLLSSSFTNGNILRILGRNKFYLKNASTIEDLARINHVVFDKTGTLTSGDNPEIIYEGSPLSADQKKLIASLVSQSTHPLCVLLTKYYSPITRTDPQRFKETTGRGIEAFINGNHVKLGSSDFVNGKYDDGENGSSIYILWNGRLMGRFLFRNPYRADLDGLVSWLMPRYRLSVLSGDNLSERKNLLHIFGQKAVVLFRQMPQDKMNYIRKMQELGDQVAMIGDGLNDAIALRESRVGIAITEDTGYFTPASDAILEARQLIKFPAFIQLCRANRKIITVSFIISIVYNIAGLFFAVQGTLSPVIAAILMPVSSISILLVTFGSSNGVARWLRL
jgi:P-type Cu+ transporter